MQPDFPRLESERLTIRFPMPEDAEEVHAAIQESWPELHRWMDWADALPTLEACERKCRAACQAYLERARKVIHEIPFGLFLKGTGTLVGRSDIHNIDWSAPQCEIGYWVRARFARKGYVTEAVGVLTTYAFDVVGAQRVWIRCDAGNARSAAVPRRLGFVHEGTLKDDRRRPRTGELADTLVFSRTRTGWSQTRTGWRRR